MMDRDVGDRAFPIWLLGDSNPLQWQEKLNTPLDPRHPIRHNIWTSVLDVVQDCVFRSGRCRVDTESLYIRNAVDDPSKKPISSSVDWLSGTNQEIKVLHGLLARHQPPIVCCFGAFAFEFARRAQRREPIRSFGYWGALRLGEEFRTSAKHFDVTEVNLLPLLHRSIAGGKFIESHEYFCAETGANYFEYVGTGIAEILIQHKDRLSVWID
jgi:hypothetical protein